MINCSDNFCFGFVLSSPIVVLLTFLAQEHRKRPPPRSEGKPLKLSDALHAALVQEKVNITDSVLSLGVTDLAATDGQDVSAPCSPTNTFPPFRYRSDLGSVLRQLNFSGVGVEVGVKQGLFTETLLKTWGQAALFVQVDLWAQQANYADEANVEDSVQMLHFAESFARAQKMVEKGYARSALQCRNFSTACARLFPDRSLDFVYIDARHDRKGVLEDLQAWWPKLRFGGMMAGHDYMQQREPDKVGRQCHFEVDVISNNNCFYMVAGGDPHTQGQDWTLHDDGTRDRSGRAVKGAVDDFFSGIAEEAPPELKRCPRQVVVTYRENQWNSWALRK
eukprot:gnl/TRDRNA2_/TRDRNA2_58655_c0_seq1.p1 gnl/TRDRNA2_/TRDRNA2_58655_c0~~gnl/TRDRNA2_/TRDRNA2_58655_c0_seq1.p1  ORF type:complete len:335 (-),score=38.49 gnl/TRDRNA2_/TRDRNA2_58655_c0_seq1:74-1078(-)